MYVRGTKRNYVPVGCSVTAFHFFANQSVIFFRDLKRPGSLKSMNGMTSEPEGSVLFRNHRQVGLNVCNAHDVEVLNENFSNAGRKERGKRRTESNVLKSQRKQS